MMRTICYAFIDAANLFYGGKKSLGWSVDYKKLLKYLKTKERKFTFSLGESERLKRLENWPVENLLILLSCGQSLSSRINRKKGTCEISPSRLVITIYQKVCLLSSVDETLC